MFSQKNTIPKATVLALAVACSACTLPPSPASDNLTQGMREYRNGDYSSALSQFTYHSHQQDPFAKYMEASVHLDENIPPGDEQLGVRRIKEAANLNNAIAQKKLADFHSEGIYVPLSYSEAARLYRLAYNQGDTLAGHELGVLQAQGKGLAQNYEAALLLLAEAAKKGNLAASKAHQQYTQKRDWGLVYFTPLKGAAQSFEETNNLAVKKSAETEGLIAYRKGHYGQALNDFRTLTDQGNIAGPFYLANLYFNGFGVPKDYKRAAQYYSKSAAHGHVVSLAMMGKMHIEGLGVPRNPTKAAQFFMRAMDEGSLETAHDLASLFEAGMGIQKSKIVAKALRDFSAKTLQAGAEGSLGAPRLSKQELAKSRELVREFALTENVTNPILAHLKSAQIAKNGPFPISEFPAVPPNFPGSLGCNTRCIGETCLRTYSNGERIQFPTPREFDPISLEWKTLTEPC